MPKKSKGKVPQSKSQRRDNKLFDANQGGGGYGFFNILFGQGSKVKGTRKKK